MVECNQIDESLQWRPRPTLLRYTRDAGDPGAVVKRCRRHRCSSNSELCEADSGQMLEDPGFGLRGQFLLAPKSTLG